MPGGMQYNIIVDLSSHFARRCVAEEYGLQDRFLRLYIKGGLMSKNNRKKQTNIRRKNTLKINAQRINTNQKHQKRKSAAEPRQTFAVVFFVLAVCFFIACLVIIWRGDIFRETSPEPIPLVNNTVNRPQIDLPITNLPETDAPETDAPETDAPETDAPETDAPETDAPETDAPETEEPVVNPPVQIVVVPESEQVEDSYFSDALFIGDSRTVGLAYYSGLKSNYYSEQGLNVSSVLKKGYIGDAKLTLAQALDANPGFTKVYLSFGINEIGWPSTQSFFDYYVALINLVREKLPDAAICVQAVLPMSGVTAQSAAYSAYDVNNKVVQYNTRLREICAEMGLYYLDVYEIFSDANGDLLAPDSSDGIHLGGASLRKWADYLRTHPLP